MWRKLDDDDKLVDHQGRFLLCAKCLWGSHPYDRCHREEAMVVNVVTWKRITNTLRNKGLLFFGSKWRRNRTINIWMKDSKCISSNISKSQMDLDLDIDIGDEFVDTGGEYVVDVQGDDEGGGDRKRRKVEGEKLSDEWELLKRRREKLEMAKVRMEEEWDEFDSREERLMIAKGNVEEMENELRLKSMELERLNREIERKTEKLKKDLVEVRKEEEDVLERVKFVQERDAELKVFLSKIEEATRGKEMIEKLIDKKVVGSETVRKNDEESGGDGSDEKEKLLVVNGEGVKVKVGVRRFRREMGLYYPDEKRVLYKVKDEKRGVFRREVELWRLGEKSGVVIGKLTKELMVELNKVGISRSAMGVKEFVRVVVEKGKEDIENWRKGMRMKE